MASSSRRSSRQRMLQSACELFAAQGITDTPTKQIAEQAAVNEATLFRQFGSKAGLLLAVLEDEEIVVAFIQRLIHAVAEVNKGATDFKAVVRTYAAQLWHGLEQAPQLTRSLIGETGGEAMDAHRVAVGEGMADLTQRVADYLAAEGDRHGVTFAHSPTWMVQMLHYGVLGAVVMALTGGESDESGDRNALLLTMVDGICAVGLVQPPSAATAAAAQVGAGAGTGTGTGAGTVSAVGLTTAPLVEDLSAALVHEILQRAKKQGALDYAVMYTLFGAGLLPQELVEVQRQHHISDRDQHLLLIPHGRRRQVPIGQWIGGKRYGNYQKNPLTQWLKTRKDDHPALFVTLVSDAVLPLNIGHVQGLWTTLTQDLTTLTGRSPRLEQIQQTWCVDLIMRGMTAEHMQILTGWTSEQIEPYIQRAQEKAAIEQAIALDRKPPG